MIFDLPGLLLTVGLMIIMGLASRNVQSTFKKYSQIPVRSRMSGAQAARYILDSNGLRDVAVERVAGDLTDHYDPRSRVLRLSDPVYSSASISAVGVAAHEAGHALQHQVGYAPLNMRQTLYPVASFGSNIGMWMIMAGLFLGMGSGLALMKGVAVFGLVLYSMGVLFTVITLPVEFNASNRALAQLTQYGIVSTEEHQNTKKVLNAAALTYVAAAFGAIMQLLYLASFILGDRD
jgi:uncharacterized protein